MIFMLSAVSLLLLSFCCKLWLPQSWDFVYDMRNYWSKKWHYDLDLGQSFEPCCFFPLISIVSTTKYFKHHYKMPLNKLIIIRNLTRNTYTSLIPLLFCWLLNSLFTMERVTNWIKVKTVCKLEANQRLLSNGFHYLKTSVLIICMLWEWIEIVHMYTFCTCTHPRITFHASTNHFVNL